MILLFDLQYRFLCKYICRDNDDLVFVYKIFIDNAKDSSTLNSVGEDEIHLERNLCRKMLR